MSYAVSAALQSAIYEALINDTALTGLVGMNIFDAVPAGNVPNLYVALGAETVLDRSHKTGHAAEHRLVLSVVTDQAGFQTAKEVAAAIGDALLPADLTLSRGRLVSLTFLRASARREGTGQLRRIDLTFRALVEDA